MVNHGGLLVMRQTAEIKDIMAQVGNSINLRVVFTDSVNREGLIFMPCNISLSQLLKCVIII